MLCDIVKAILRQYGTSAYTFKKGESVIACLLCEPLSLIACCCFAVRFQRHQLYHITFLMMRYRTWQMQAA